MNFYVVVRNICKAAMKLFYRVEHINSENIPTEGGVLFCSNHTSNLDPVMLGITNRREFSFMAKESLIKIPLLGIIIKNLGVIPVKRNSNDILAIKKAIEALNGGKAIMIFPEGTRHKDGVIRDAKDGAALLIKKTGTTVVPCALTKHRLFKKSKVIFGKPLDMSEYKDSKDLKLITNKVMDEVKKLYEELNNEN